LGNHFFNDLFGSTTGKESIMATKRTTTAPVETITSAAATPLQAVNAGIITVIEATRIDAQKSRYKAMRAIAYQAFTESIKAGDYEALVQRAIANVDALPSGWEIKAR